jgi:hypothetical protein
MTRWLQNLLGAALLGFVLCVGYYACWTMQEIGLAARQTGEAAVAGKAVLGKLDATLDRIKAPCSPGPCGTLASIDKAVIKFNDIAVDVHTQVRQSGTLIAASSASLTAASSDLHTVAAGLSGLSAQATVDLQTANESFKALQPVIGQFQGLARDADAVVSDPALRDGIDSTAETAANVAGVTSDLQKVTHHFEPQIDNPKPHHWYTGVKTAWQVIWQLAMLAK